MTTLAKNTHPNLLFSQDEAVVCNSDGGLFSVKNNANGNCTHQDRLISSSKPLTIPSRQVSYTADALGRRIERRVDNQPESGFIYQDRLNPIARTDSQGTIQEFFVYGEQGNVPAYLLKDGKTYRYITNHLGSPVMLVDSETGEITQEITYDVWGNVLSDSNPDFQPFYFAGGIYDQDTKLTRFGARDYDAQLGRWTAKDPIGFNGGLASLYSYVGGDPVNFVDPSGKKSVLDTMGDFFSGEAGAVSGDPGTGVGGQLIEEAPGLVKSSFERYKSQVDNGLHPTPGGYHKYIEDKLYPKFDELYEPGDSWEDMYEKMKKNLKERQEKEPTACFKLRL